MYADTFNIIYVFLDLKYIISMIDYDISYLHFLDS